MNLNKDCKNAEYLQSRLILLKTNLIQRIIQKNKRKY